MAINTPAATVEFRATLLLFEARNLPSPPESRPVELRSHNTPKLKIPIIGCESNALVVLEEVASV